MAAPLTVLPRMVPSEVPALTSMASAVVAEMTLSWTSERSLRSGSQSE